MHNQCILIAMPAGPKHDPVPLKILKGRGSGKDSRGYSIPAAPSFERAAPEPPDWMTGEARALWDRIAPGLERLDLLKPEDFTAFTAYCETWATYVEAVQRLRCEGLTVTHAKTGMVHKNPTLTAVEQAGAQCLRFAVEFGLTPVAEISLARPPRQASDADDPFAADSGT